MVVRWGGGVGFQKTGTNPRKQTHLSIKEPTFLVVGRGWGCNSQNTKEGATLSEHTSSCACGRRCGGRFLTTKRNHPGCEQKDPSIPSIPFHSIPCHPCTPSSEGGGKPERRKKTRPSLPPLFVSSFFPGALFRALSLDSSDSQAKMWRIGTPRSRRALAGPTPPPQSVAKTRLGAAVRARTAEKMRGGKAGGRHGGLVSGFEGQPKGKPTFL